VPRYALLLTTAAVAALSLAGPAPVSAQDKPVIALSNSFYGNTWRRQMVDAFTEQAEKAKSEGLIEDFVVLNGENCQDRSRHACAPSTMAELPQSWARQAPPGSRYAAMPPEQLPP
jgi:hypothetical protein